MSGKRDRDRPGYRDLSYWHDTCGDDLTPRPGLPGDTVADVAIVGAGFSGLWTAYYLARHDPALRVVVLEREIAGFGASGRNGGWCSALFAGSRERSARTHGRAGAAALQRAMFDTVDEVGRAAAEEGIDCDFAKGGTIDVATGPAHVERLQAELAHHREWGFGEDDYRWLASDESGACVGMRPNLGALYTPHCASIHPAKLARGLARAVERRGVAIHEQTAVTALESRRVPTTHGTVRADVVVRATEAYTPQLPGLRRDLVPLYSLMIATAPLPDEFWATAGLHRRETFADARHMVIYGQRTADGRFAFGGRGAPYHFGSRVEPAFDRVDRVFRGLAETLRALFPALGEVEVTHRWGGPVGVPRDWYTSVGYDRGEGLALVSGYVGDGVSTTNLAGRTLADLILDEESDLTELPWVGHRSRRWEPEPLRWAGVNLGRILTGSVDAAERRTGHTPRLRGALLHSLTGE